MFWIISVARVTKLSGPDFWQHCIVVSCSYLVHPEAILAPNNIIAPPTNPTHGTTPSC